MDDRLICFLTYDYAEARTIATTLLTTAGGLLAGGIVFANKFIELHRVQHVKAWRRGMLGLYAFASAGLCAGSALIGNYADMVKLLRTYRSGIADVVGFDQAVIAHNSSNGLLFVGAGVLMLIGMVTLLASADGRRHERQSAGGGVIADSAKRIRQEGDMPVDRGPTLTAKEVAAVHNELRRVLGLSTEEFSTGSFIGMVSDEIEQLRATGRSDAAIAALVSEISGKPVTAELISGFYASPEAGHHGGE